MARDTTRRRTRRMPSGPVQRPWRRTKNPYRPIEVLSADQLEHIHNASLDVLERLGLDMWCDEAMDIFSEAGAEVDRAGRHVRFDRTMIEEAIAHAPAEFTLSSRNPDRSVTLGGNNINFGLVGGPGFSTNLDRGRRGGKFEDTCELIRLAQCLNVLHIIHGGAVAPNDLAPTTRHLDVMRATLTMTDKVTGTGAFGRLRTNDGINMLCIARRMSRDELRLSPGALGNVNCNSPLRYDGPMLEGVIELARADQPVIITPFTLLGAMAPVTLAGALTQQNAEALVGIALTQLVNPGAPVMYGGFTSNVDMKSGAPAFGTPEYMRATQMTGQMVRRYGLPMRSSGACAANVPDGQAMWETSNSLWAAVQSGTNVVYHAAGWLEGGLIASPEKFVMDCEVIQQIQRYMDPETFATTPDDLALSAIREVRHQGHFFGTRHTQERYTTAFYQPFLSDWRNFEAWQAEGGIWTAERAHHLYKRILAEFEPPPMDDGIRQELAEFVERRKLEGGAPTDF